MKKLISLAAAALAVLILTGCSAGSTVLPPHRTGAASLDVSLEQFYTLESAMEEADLVALVRIGSWIGETSEGTFTYYQAHVLKTFKGSTSEEIALVQDGNSVRSIAGFPLFTAGNEFLLFLKQGTGTEYANFFWMLGSFTAFFDTVRDGKGALYYMDRFGIIGSSAEGCENFLFDTDKADELRQAAAKADPEAEGYRYHYIFSAAELDPILESLSAAAAEQNTEPEE